MRKPTRLALGAGAIALVVVVVVLVRGRRESETPAAPAGDSAASVDVDVVPPSSAPGSRPQSLPSALPSSNQDAGLAGRREPTGRFGPGTMKAIPARYELVTKDDYVAVNLAGGSPTVFRPSFRAVAPQETRELRGRVIDLANQPVPGAVVLASKSIDVFGGQLLADAGATAAADGTFVIAKAPTNAVIQAIDRTGWSEVLVTTGAPIDLVIRGRGELRGTLTYDGHAESFQLFLARHGEPPFRVFYESDPDGTYVFASLPVGAYTVTIGLAQSIGGGSSKTVKREITIEAGKTTRLDLDQRSSTVVVASTRLPAGFQLKTIEYVLLPGRPPADRTEAKTRSRAGESTMPLFGGRDANTPMQFHDVEPGAYHACSAVNDDALWGCAPVVVVDGDVAREVEIPVTAPPSAVGN